jgi:hypothetical protein
MEDVCNMGHRNKQWVIKAIQKYKMFVGGSPFIPTIDMRKKKSVEEGRYINTK